MLVLPTISIVTGIFTLAVTICTIDAVIIIEKVLELHEELGRHLEVS